MQTIRKIMFVFTLGLILSGCSSQDSKESNHASSDDSNESSSLFGNMFGSSDDSTSADEMRLENYTGSITLQNNSEEKAVVLGSRLVTGDNIETMTESNAYVVLDQSKVLRVNETSQVEIIQEEKHLDIHLSKGTLFFNVTTTLSEEETLEFHTNNVVTGVRGTSGIITIKDNVTQIAILSGFVEGTTEGEVKTISPGEVGIITTQEDGTVDFEILQLEEEEPRYFYSNDFIDTIQGDLDSSTFSYAQALKNPYEEYETLYASVIAQYQDFLDHGTIPEDNVYLSNSYNLSKIESTTYFAYLFYDLNNDGMMEIVFYRITPDPIDSYSFFQVFAEIYTVDNFLPIRVTFPDDEIDKSSILDFYDADPVVIYRLCNYQVDTKTTLETFYHMIDNQMVEIPTPENRSDLKYMPFARYHYIEPQGSL